MTQEQFIKAAQIHDKIKNLADILCKINHSALSYAKVSTDAVGNKGYELIPDWMLLDIKDILKKHNVLIHEEITELIKRLEEEIESI